MDILILHPTYPGQFLKQIHWYQSQGHSIIFLAEQCRLRPEPPTKVLLVSSETKSDERKEKKISTEQRYLRMGVLYAKKMTRLKRKGYSPEVIISHSGWGCGLFCHRVWPNANRIAYCEWFFASLEDPLESYNNFCRFPLTPYRLRGQGNVRDYKKPGRSSHILYELAYASTLVSPTYWQRHQLPRAFRDRCRVIYDGVESHGECETNRERGNQRDQFLITYGTRGMEPMRGFPELIEELPKILERYSDLIIEIAGADETVYDSVKPLDYKSWGEWAQKRLERWIRCGRVRFLGKLPAEAYWLWLRKSDLHIYLTQPYVCSWSLLDAMAAACCIVCSDVEPVREFLCEDSATFVDHRRHGWLSEVLTQLKPQAELRHAKATAAKSLSNFYHIDRTKELWQSLIWHKGLSA